MNTPAITVDLVSDTATRPSEPMRRAMAYADVGDEQRDEDPTVNALVQKVATLLGKEAAIFLPSGTMANQISLAVHCSAGDEILAAANAHILSSEGAGAAVFCGSLIRGIPTATGIFSADDLADSWQPGKLKAPRPRLVVIEQTSNRGGGAVWPLETLADVARWARDKGMAVHMDGARLMNAVVAGQTPAHDFAAHCDSVWIDLSKGLGCPVGSVLAGSRDFIARANVWKHRFGGAMRQAGILAAAGIYALDHHVQDLAHDHRRARDFANAIGKLPGVTLVNPEVQTNLVFLDIRHTGQTSNTIATFLRTHGIRIGVESPTLMRAVFHRDINDNALAQAIDRFEFGVRANFYSDPKFTLTPNLL
ncbi:MAG: low specificity L-threonine aldolase [Burkholderiaceae bacterium]